MNELYHYGIPRRSGRYPYGSGDRPYQSISRKEINRVLKGRKRGEIFRQSRIISKGTILYRTTSDPNEMNKGSTYVTYMQPDRDLYRGSYIKYKAKGAPVYEKTMELKEDLNVPSRDIVKETVSSVISENPKLLDITIEKYLGQIFGEDTISEYKKYVYSDGTTAWKTLLESSLETVKNRPLEDTFSSFVMTFGINEELKNKTINKLKKQGYNAMVDEAGVGAKSPEGIDPLIIFDYKKSVDLKDMREVTDKEAEKASKNYTKWQTKTKKRWLQNKKEW